MNCETTADYIPEFVAGTLAPTVRADIERHISRCAECGEALRGAEALVLLKNRPVDAAPAGLFERAMGGVDEAPAARSNGKRGFWLGAGFGGAIAASVVMLALTLGWIGPQAVDTPDTPQFTVAISEPRNMEIAIETDRALANASISILLSGGVALDGYGDRRELAWTTDLEAGVNRLSLPIMAIDSTGGQIVVRLDHPNSEQLFVVQLKTDA